MVAAGRFAVKHNQAHLCFASIKSQRLYNSIAPHFPPGDEEAGMGINASRLNARRLVSFGLPYSWRPIALLAVTKLLALLMAVAFGPIARAAVVFEAPPPTSEQIETDWLRQETLRQQPRVEAPRLEADAAGAVDGVKNGQWGFHTQHEPNPWWQVDLQAPVQLDRVVLWNRL